MGTYDISLFTGGKTYNIKVTTEMTPIYQHGDTWGNIIFEKICTFEGNGVKGFGITEFCYRYDSRQ